MINFPQSADRYLIAQSILRHSLIMGENGITVFFDQSETILTKTNPRCVLRRNDSNSLERRFLTQNHPRAKKTQLKQVSKAVIDIHR